jgi:hypothetical protein
MTLQAQTATRSHDMSDLRTGSAVASPMAGVSDLQTRAVLLQCSTARACTECCAPLLQARHHESGPAGRVRTASNHLVLQIVHHSGKEDRGIELVPAARTQQSSKFGERSGEGP